MYADVRIVENRFDIDPDRVDMVLARLNAAGYNGDYEVLGRGMTALVLRDLATGNALKVAWDNWGSDAELIEREYEFLVSLEDSPVAAFLPKVFLYDAHTGVLIREGIEGRPGGWGTRGLGEVYDQIVAEARKHGWSHPEFKEDSFVVRDDGSIVMVDVGFAQPIGFRLVDWVKRVLASPVSHKRQVYADLAWALRMDASDGLIPAEVAEDLQRQMESITGGSLG